MNTLMKIPLQVENELLKHFHPITIKNQKTLICNMLARGSNEVSIRHIIDAIRSQYEILLEFII